MSRRRVAEALSPARCTSPTFSQDLFANKSDKECLNACIYCESPVGMSRGHGAIQLRSPGMGEQKLQNQSTDEGTVASRMVGNQRHSNKRNLDYVLKSGLCGGLAGCAVCTCRSF